VDGRPVAVVVSVVSRQVAEHVKLQRARTSGKAQSPSASATEHNGATISST